MSSQQQIREQVKEEVISRIKDFLPPEFSGAEIALQEVTKNNGVKLDALNIRRDGQDKAVPAIYLNGFYEQYENGAEIEVILEEIAEMHLTHLRGGESMQTAADRFMDPEYVKDNVIIVTVNAEKNADLLRESPHMVKEDLAMIYKVYVGQTDGEYASVTVKNEHLKMWGISQEELHERALSNSNRLNPAEFMKITEMLKMMGMPDCMSDAMGEERFPLYVITNRQKLHGAAVIMYSNCLEQLSEKLGCDLYILPSSIHEVLALPVNNGDAKELAMMVREINQSTVAETEVLSDSVYKYDAKKKDFAIEYSADMEQLKKDEVFAQDSMTVEDSITVEVNTETEGAAKPRHHRKGR
ncbi:MAG: DUF5688 family protein [Lachnospiraceae bacterium]|nr:DUF5688 family protein [Lachnospiraceae bacterium]